MRGRRPGARVGPRGFSDDADEARAVRDAWNATALGHRFARDLLDIGGERNRRRGADRHPDAIGVDRALRGLELTDPRRVQSARDEYPDVAEPGLVEPSPDLFDGIAEQQDHRVRHGAGRALQSGKLGTEWGGAAGAAADYRGVLHRRSDQRVDVAGAEADHTLATRGFDDLTCRGRPAGAARQHAEQGCLVGPEA